jgi:hypothetical protein
MAFEIGNPDLKKEFGDGLDLLVYHDASRLRGEWNLFFYRLDDFVYMTPNREGRHRL